jgi:uncharacterized membrane protein
MHLGSRLPEDGDESIEKANADYAARNPTQYNIEAIARLEEEAVNRRTATEGASDGIVKIIGNVPFLLLQAVLIFA